jgi:hypothetical protein
MSREWVRTSADRTWMRDLDAPVHDFVPRLARRQAVAEQRLLV